ncbi:hypothetical protein [Methanosphaera sp. WGK6]|uniref:hypothetical protein n=1 Tax=Methanosphaera sp. WGK6 TaxID=1561964 RepID=UPI000A054309|nr:hypothetical protein [Methanosphaera sp. WGK6]
MDKQLFQKKIRKEFNITEDSYIEWGKNESGELQVKIKDKKPTFENLIGLGKSMNKTNAVKLKKELYK